jgi:hypothetical protein
MAFDLANKIFEDLNSLKPSKQVGLNGLVNAINGSLVREKIYPHTISL